MRLGLLHRLVFFVLACILSGCSDQRNQQKEQAHFQPYSPALVSNFVTACVKGGVQGESFCRCVVTEISKQLPEEEYIRQEMDFAASKKLPEGLGKAMASAQVTCMRADMPQTGQK